jgi:hypothetical protein
MQLNMDLTGVDDHLKPQPIKPGWYQAIITDAGQKMAKSSGNSYLSLTWTVINGSCKGRLVFDSIMLTGNGAKFGLTKLKTIAKAIGHRNPNYIHDTSELVQRPCYINVGMRQQEGYDDSNKINNYYNDAEYRARIVGRNTPGTPVQTQPAATEAIGPPPPPQENQTINVPQNNGERSPFEAQDAIVSDEPPF